MTSSGSSQHQTAYDDSYGTCARTYASLVVNRKSLDLAEVRRLLDVVLVPIGANAAKLTTEGAISSLDLRRHLDWLTEKLTPEATQRLRDAGYTAHVSAYWLSKHGHGGPVLSTPQMSRLSTLGLELDLDVYCSSLADSEP